jgi:hypothetical protein
MKRLAWLLIGIISISGCASSTLIHRDGEGVVYKVESRGNVKTVVKQDGVEISQDSRQEPLLKFEIPAMKVGD